MVEEDILNVKTQLYNSFNLYGVIPVRRLQNPMRVIGFLTREKFGPGVLRMGCAARAGGPLSGRKARFKVG